MTDERNRGVLPSGLNAQFLGRDRLDAIGFAAVGQNVWVHPFAVIVRPENISLGDNVRIDPFAILSATGKITIGSHVHLASHCTLMGAAPITIEDFCVVSLGARVFSSSEDLNAVGIVGAMIPPEFLRTTTAPVHFARHTAIGTATVVLPGVTLREGAAVGAFSLVTKSLREWWAYQGIPARPLHERSREALLSEQRIAQQRRRS